MRSADMDRRDPRTVLARLASAAVLLVAPAFAAAAEPGATPLAAPLLKMVVGLLAVLAVLLLASRLLPRLGGFNLAINPQFKVLATLAVGQRERVLLMQAGRRQIVVGVAPGRVTTLHVLEEPLEMQARNPQSATGVQGWLSRVLAGRDG